MLLHGLDLSLESILEVLKLVFDLFELLIFDSMSFAFLAFCYILITSEVIRWCCGSKISILSELEWFFFYQFFIQSFDFLSHGWDVMIPLKIEWRIQTAVGFLREKNFLSSRWTNIFNDWYR